MNSHPRKRKKTKRMAGGDEIWIVCYRAEDGHWVPFGGSDVMFHERRTALEEIRRRVERYYMPRRFYRVIKYVREVTNGKR